MVIRIEPTGDPRFHPATAGLSCVLGVALAVLLATGCSSQAPTRVQPRVAALADGRFVEPPTRPDNAVFPFPEEEQDPVEDGPAPVARMALRAPERESFVLHGTLPIPRGALTLEPQRTSLCIVDHDPGRTSIPAQVRVITRYPGGEPAVLEVAARVQRRPEARPGAMLSYSVVLDDAPRPDPAAAPAAVAQLLDPASPEPLRLRCRDVFENVYEVDLRGAQDSPGFGSRQRIAEGPAYTRWRTYSTLVPVTLSGNGPPLEHLMGVHAYLTQRAGDERVSLELRVHNGCTSGASSPSALESPVGIVYWDSLELVMPRRWRARPLVADPAIGRHRTANGEALLPLVAANEDGSLHMMGPQAQFNRRLTLVLSDVAARPRPKPALEGLAFCIRGPHLWSWWNPDSAAFFAQHALLPHWSSFERDGRRGNDALRAVIGARLTRVRRTLETGQPQGGLLAGSRMGWAHPLGVSVQGMTGGSGIQAFEGHRIAAAASALGIEAIMLEHRMNATRQPEAQWNRFGAPVGYHLWRGKKDRVPFDFRTNGNMVPPQFKLPCKAGPRASQQLREVHLRGVRPAYDQGTSHLPGGALPGRSDALLAWWPHDGQHMVRYSKNLKALVWLAGDALAHDDLMHSAELFHLAFHEGRHRAESWSHGVTLRIYEGLVQAYPGHGLPTGRDQAWGIDLACAAYCAASPQWRELNLPWFRRIGTLLVNAAMPNGVIQRQPNHKILGGKFDASQAFETHFLLHAQRCLIESALRGPENLLVDQLVALHNRTLEFLYWGPVWTESPPTAGAEVGSNGPRWHFAVAPLGGWEVKPYSDVDTWGEDYLPPGGVGLGVDTHYGWGPLEYGMLTSRKAGEGSLENRYLRRSLDYWTHPGNYRSLLKALFSASVRDSGDNSGNWAGYVGRLQAHMGR